MRIKIRQPKNKGWHIWFAWYPVRVDNHVVWVEYVWRRRTVQSAGWAGDTVQVDYQLSEDEPVRAPAKS